MSIVTFIQCRARVETVAVLVICIQFAPKSVDLQLPNRFSARIVFTSPLFMLVMHRNINFFSKTHKIGQNFYSIQYAFLLQRHVLSKEYKKPILSRALNLHFFGLLLDASQWSMISYHSRQIYEIHIRRKHRPRGGRTVGQNTGKIKPLRVRQIVPK